MQSSNCLNCGTPVDRKFCPECGQRTDSHRITPKHFIMHDLVHGVMHIDKGIPYTLKQAVTRPGYAARDYILGKRVKFYNIFYLLLLALGLLLYIDAIKEGYNPHAFATKASYLTFVPLYALAGFILFPKFRYNYFEHLIIGGMTQLCILIVLLLSSIFQIWDSVVLFYLSEGLSYIQLILPVIIYYQIAKDYYKLFDFIWRIILLVPLVMLSQTLITMAYRIIISLV